MTRKDFKSLKIGDVISPNRGKNKGQRAIVKDIWGVMMYADFVDKNLHAQMIIGRCHDIFSNYKVLTKE